MGLEGSSSCLTSCTPVESTAAGWTGGRTDEDNGEGLEGNSLLFMNHDYGSPSLLSPAPSLPPVTHFSHCCRDNTYLNHMLLSSAVILLLREACLQFEAALRTVCAASS